MLKIIRLFIMMDNLIILIKIKPQKDFKYVIILVNFFTFCINICFGYSKKCLTVTILLSKPQHRFYWCRLLITIANSLGPDQARQNVGPDLESNCLPL